MIENLLVLKVLFQLLIYYIRKNVHHLILINELLQTQMGICQFFFVSW